jgi:hypothetical protein
MKKRVLVQLGTLVVLVGVLVGLLTQQQALRDWWRLRSYIAPAAISTLASQDTMTPRAQRLFYVNRPVVGSGILFNTHCPTGGEKTVVLGCYLGNDRGIYVYAVTDSRLDGVEQVTAAHEMLHAAYRRLHGSERQNVDAMLTDYYQHDLADQRVKDTIEAYKKSEPHDVVNEMHSVFGTEVANLPAPLEQYYKRYFTDRSRVTAYTAAYQGEFTGRQKQVADYDAQLKSMDDQIKANEAQLTTQRASLDSQRAQLDSQQRSGQIAAYNSGVPAYNRAVNAYNALLNSVKNLINQYNDIVAQRNAIALEEQQLAKELSNSSLPAN